MDTALDRFIHAHDNHFADALAEIRSGRKRTHWMWFIFPQLKGLGSSETANYYGIRDLEEASKFLQHPIFGNNLIRICKVLTALNGKTAYEIFGTPDDLKLHSSLTLFSLLKETDPIFRQLIDKYFDGRPDGQTFNLLEKKGH